MPSKIRVLSDDTINKIAAGEVIENPSSVVKELVENSLDAGATDICVEIVGGGQQLIRITDNGCGMNPDDAVLCLERHATSKIRAVEDLEGVASMGFRGEAIPSIASISKLTLLTRPIPKEKENTEATLVIVDGGKIVKCCSAERSPGTTIEIKSLFFNVPVRKKFQKSPIQDASEISKVMTLITLGTPHVKFQLISNHTTLLSTPLYNSDHFCDHLGERIRLTLGEEFHSGILPINDPHDICAIRGFIGKPAHHRHQKTGQFLFINQRPVSSPFVSQVIREAYGTILPTYRHPVFVLHLSLQGSLIDVNVHPQKKEVRLRQENMLRERLLQVIVNKIHCSNHALPPVSMEKPDELFLFGNTAPKTEEQSNSPICEIGVPLVSEKQKTILDVPEPFQKLKEHISNTTNTFNPVMTPSLAIRSTPKAALPITIDPTSFQQQKEIPKAIGTLCNYIITIEEDKLHLWDQQGMHQRIIYERLLRQQSGDSEVQSLLIPVTIELPKSDAAVLREFVEELNFLGIGIREFGQDTFCVDAIPAFLKCKDVNQIILEMLSDLHGSSRTGILEREKKKRLAIVASKAAIGSNKRLPLAEAQALIDECLRCENADRCPQGKPIKLSMTPEEVRKRLSCEY